jgi:aminoglycoside phosphotransferase (APT) family kinase protein
MPLESSEVALPDDLLTWMEEVGGGVLVAVDRRPGGGRKEAWVVDLKHRDGTVRPCFLRYDRSDPTRTKDPWTLHREATVYLALQDSEVPVPRVLGVHDTYQAMLSERVRGEAWFSRITDAGEREATAHDFMVRLAALHGLDATVLDLPHFPHVRTVSEAVHAELDELEKVMAERGGEPDPALAFSLRWLRRHVPEDDRPPVLVQGDTGPGNFLYEGGRVTAVLDWELAHLGDPMDDIAWLSLRATQEPFGDFPTRVREYEALSGRRVDEARVLYFQVMAETKLQVMAHRPRASERSGLPEVVGDVDDAGDDRGAAAGGGGGDAGNAFIYGLLHRRLWLEALAPVAGVALTPVEELRARRSEDHDWMYGAVLAQLRHVIVPRTNDALAKARGKGIARLVKYLSRLDVYGSYYESCELGDLRTLLRAPVDSVSAGRTAAAGAVREGSVTDEDYLAVLWRRIARSTELARPAMGILADRHWPRLR